MRSPYRLHGTPGSLYTAKARSFLIKQGIPFEDAPAGAPGFREVVVPAVGRWIIPVLETPDGDFLQDGSEIIDRFEREGDLRWPTLPQTPALRVAARLFELFGGEGLLRPAMHYRWNFDAVNQPFIGRDFAAGLAAPGAPAAEGEATFAFAAERMRRAMSGFGVSPESIPLVEAAYEEFLDLFDAHLAASPYLLGGHPTVGDYGMIGPLYAHLGRDPYPAQLMKRRAYRVWRWVERMNASGLDAGEYPDCPPELFADDALPATLRALLAFIARDYLPELRAMVAFTDSWLEARPDIATGTNGLKRPGDRVIGQVAFDWRGVPITVNVMPYRLYLLQKVQDAIPAAGEPGHDAVMVMLDGAGLAEIATLRTRRRVERREQVEVWGPVREG
jgi:glutathione S-transferase